MNKNYVVLKMGDELKLCYVGEEQELMYYDEAVELLYHLADTDMYNEYKLARLDFNLIY